MMESDRNPPALPSRRAFIGLGIGAFVVAAVPLARQRQRELLVRRSVPAMGTIAEIAVGHRDKHYANAAIDAALAELRRVETVMSRFRADSDVGRANRDAATRAVQLSAETAKVVDEALRWAEASDGAFDPALARAVALWDVTKRHEPPATEHVRQFASRGFFRSVELGKLAGHAVIVFNEADVGLDLGGIAKGYGVDAAVATLRDWGIRHALVNLGGDLYALGDSPGGDPWRIGIRSPKEPSSIVGQFEAVDLGVATSGDYEQYFQFRGERFHHLLDPSTGAPRRSAAHAVTVTAADCMTADVAATTVFGMAGSAADRLLAVHAPGAHIVRSV